MLDDYSSYWPMNEATGSATLIDIAGGKNATVAFPSDATSVDGKIGKAKTWGVINYATCGNVIDKIHTDSFTIAFWMKPGTGDFVMGIFSKCEQFGYDIKIQDNANGQNRLFFKYKGVTLGDTIKTNTTGLNNDTWTHVVCTRDGTDANGMKIYLNGVADYVVHLNQGADIGSNSVDLTIACTSNNTGVNNYYTGLLDDLRFYDRVLSPSEANQLFLFGGVRFNNRGIRPRPFAPCLAR